MPPNAPIGPPGGRPPDGAAAGRGAGVALIAHGAGSSPEFVRRVFGDALATLGLRTVSWPQRAGDRGQGIDAELAAMAERHRPVLVGGVSLGAHAAARWAAGTGFAGPLLLVMPAWTGRSGPVGAAAAAAADEVERDGLDAVLARIRLSAMPWVADELARAWTRYGTAGLARALRAAAAYDGPQPRELAAVVAATGVVALDGDPQHPREVAERWARLLPVSGLEVVPCGPAAPDLGGAALAALHTARLAGGRAVSGSRRSRGRARAG